jgi:hypothetical protein
MAIALAQMGTLASARTGWDAGSGERGPLSALSGAAMWLNSPPLTAAELEVGKYVIAVTSISARRLVVRPS